MAANYNRPKPIDPIWYRQGCYLRIQCACGRRVVAPLGDFARSRRISFDTRIYELIARLRCRPRSEARRGGNACVSTCRSRWSPMQKKKKEDDIKSQNKQQKQ